MVVSSESTWEPLLFQQTQKSDSLNDDLIQFSKTQETEDDDDDDTLSLCDLPIYSSSNSASSSLNRAEEYQEEANTVFEFFSVSGELASKSSYQEDDDDDDDAIIFCGKLIACKDVVDQDKTLTPGCEKASPRHDRVKDGDLKPRNRRALFSWRKFKIGSFRKSASHKKAAASSNGQSLSSHSSSSASSKINKDETRRVEKMSSAKKVSTLFTSPTKSRWYLFMFGQTRFPQAMTMDLSDLKNRQRRRCSPSPSMNLRAPADCGEEAGGSRSRGRGLWTLLMESASTVSKTSANDVVRAVGCISIKC